MLGIPAYLYRLVPANPILLRVVSVAGRRRRDLIVRCAYLGLLIFLVSVAVMIGVSHATAAPSDRQLAGLTYATITREQRDASRRSWDWREAAGSAVVLALIAVTYVYFSG